MEGKVISGPNRDETVRLRCLFDVKVKNLEVLTGSTKRTTFGKESKWRQLPIAAIRSSTRPPAPHHSHASDDTTCYRDDAALLNKEAFRERKDALVLAMTTILFVRHVSFAGIAQQPSEQRVWRQIKCQVITVELTHKA